VEGRSAARVSIPFEKSQGISGSAACYLHASMANPFRYRARPTGAKKKLQTLNLSLMSTNESR